MIRASDRCVLCCHRHRAYVYFAFRIQCTGYNDEIDRDTLPHEVPSTETPATFAALRHAQLDLHLTADVLRDVKLANRVMGTMVDACTATGRTLPDREFNAKAYEHTAPGSRLRSMLVDLWISRRGGEGLAEAADVYPRDFVNELVVKLLPNTQKWSNTQFSEWKQMYCEPEDESA